MTRRPLSGASTPGQPLGPHAGRTPAAAPDRELNRQPPRESAVRSWVRNSHTWTILGVVVGGLSIVVAIVAYLFPRAAPEARPPKERAAYIAAVDTSCSRAYQQIVDLGSIPTRDPVAYGAYLRQKAEALDHLYRQWERERIPPGDDEQAKRVLSKLSSLTANLMEASRQLLGSNVEAGTEHIKSANGFAADFQMEARIYGLLECPKIF